MKAKIFFVVAIFLTTIFKAAGTTDGYIVSSYTGTNARITITSSEFNQNTFSVFVNIEWVNDRLKTTKNAESVMAVLLDSLKIIPAKSLIIPAKIRISQFSNTQTEIKFLISPEFEGGKVVIELPVIFAENTEEAQKGNWKEVLYSSPKKIRTEYEISPEKITDVYPPLIRVNSPLPDPKTDEKVALVNSKSVTLNISAYDKSGIKELKINNKKAEVSFNGDYTANLTLYTGANTIIVTAIDNNGNKGETEVELICTYQYDLQLRGGNYYALLISEDDYKDPNIGDLDKPFRDAESLKNALLTNYTFEESNIIQLKNATQSQLIAALETLSDKLTNNDNLLIFYAGHGYWDEFKEIGYWLPSDAIAGDYSTWFRNSTIKEYIGAIKSKQTLLITDACFSGSIFKTRATQAEKVVAFQKIYDLPGRKGMTSGTLKEVPDNSVFLATMVKRLNENEDKYLTSSALFLSLRDAVLNNTQNVPQFGTIQGAGDEGGEFIFIKR